MLPAIQGSEESCVETETSNDLVSTGSTEKSTKITPGSTGDATEDDLLHHSDSDGIEGEVYSDYSNTTKNSF